MLLQPPSFEFTQYLRALLQRLPQRPLPRARLSELGLSPARARNVYGASGPTPDATPMPPQYAYAPWAASHGSIPMASMQGMWPPYPYWPVQAYPLQMVPQPGYWTVAPPVWPTPWSSTSAPAPSPPPRLFHLTSTLAGLPLRGLHHRCGLHRCGPRLVPSVPRPSPDAASCSSMCNEECTARWWVADMRVLHITGLSILGLQAARPKERHWHAANVSLVLLS